jgi:hypothetical protein
MIVIVWIWSSSKQMPSAVGTAHFAWIIIKMHTSATTSNRVTTLN